MTPKKQSKRNKTMATPNKPVPAQPVSPSPMSVADQIWNDIKDREVMMFSIPNQYLSMYCDPISLDPSKCFLKYKVSAVIPAVEEAIGANRENSKYNLEVQKDYIIISRNNTLGQ